MEAASEDTLAMDRPQAVDLRTPGEEQIMNETEPESPVLSMGIPVDSEGQPINVGISVDENGDAIGTPNPIRTQRRSAQTCPCACGTARRRHNQDDCGRCGRCPPWYVVVGYSLLSLSYFFPYAMATPWYALHFERHPANPDFCCNGTCCDGSESWSVHFGLEGIRISFSHTPFVKEQTHPIHGKKRKALPSLLHPILASDGTHGPWDSTRALGSGWYEPQSRQNDPEPVPGTETWSPTGPPPSSPAVHYKPVEKFGMYEKWIDCEDISTMYAKLGEHASLHYQVGVDTAARLTDVEECERLKEEVISVHVIALVVAVLCPIFSTCSLAMGALVAYRCQPCCRRGCLSNPRVTEALGKGTVMMTLLSASVACIGLLAYASNADWRQVPHSYRSVGVRDNVAYALILPTLLDKGIEAAWFRFMFAMPDRGFVATILTFVAHTFSVLLLLVAVCKRRWTNDPDPAQPESPSMMPMLAFPVIPMITAIMRAASPPTTPRSRQDSSSSLIASTAPAQTETAALWRSNSMDGGGTPVETTAPTQIEMVDIEITNLGVTPGNTRAARAGTL